MTNANFKSKTKVKGFIKLLRNLLNWTKKNKKWVFSGLGVTIVSGLISFVISISTSQNTLNPLEISFSDAFFPGGKEATWITRIVNYSSTLSRETSTEFTFEVPLENVHISKFRSQNTGRVLLSENWANVTGKEITVLIPSIMPGEYMEIEVDGLFKEMLQGRVNALLLLKDKKGKVLDRASSGLVRGPGSWMGPHDPRIYEFHTPIKNPKL